MHEWKDSIYHFIIIIIIFKAWLLFKIFIYWF